MMGNASVGGLSSAQAGEILAKAGPNELPHEGRTQLLREITGLISSPLILILLFATSISAALGQWVDASIVLAIVLLSAGLNFFQTYRSHLAVESLREQVSPPVTALRDGEWKEIPRRDVVPGDMIRLRAGSQVPADGVLVDSQHLHVEQAALTGESLPVEKDAGSKDGAALGPTAANLVFRGTSVVSGSAIAKMTATGRGTLFGELAGRLATRRPQTEFERGLQQYSLLITRTVFFLVLFVFSVMALAGRPVLESLLFAIALAVGLTPEFLPFISTITLARGAMRMARQKVIVKNLPAIQNFGSMDILCSDKTGTLTKGTLTLAGIPDARALELAQINSQLQSGFKTPLDEAILRAGALPNAPRKLDEIPFDFERRRVSVLAVFEGRHVLITKGAPESVLAICDDAPAECGENYRELSAKGQRVLAVAWRNLEETHSIDVADECRMTFAGFLAFEDPPLADAAEAIAMLKEDGVEIKIITGDNELVAAHVCRQVGLDPRFTVLGSELASMTDSALGHVAEQTVVFARVSPGEKNRIIAALKSRGHVVGYLGDGINDAPSLHCADVGISVASAVDVARDAADIILRERSLRVLHTGILEGRRAFGNVMKYILMGTSSNFGNMFSMAAASVFLPFLPMLPTQILLNNFLYDASQVPIPTDQVDADFIRKPKRWDMAIIRSFMLRIGPISSLFDFLTFWVLLRLFRAPEALFHTGWFVESLASQTLVLLIVRTSGNPLRNPPSALLGLTIIGIVAAGAILPFTPLAEPLRFVPLPAEFFLYLFVVLPVYLGLVELAKRRILRYRD
jgi:Mg2+-importing ATPase